MSRVIGLLLRASACLPDAAAWVLGLTVVSLAVSKSPVSEA